MNDMFFSDSERVGFEDDIVMMMDVKLNKSFRGYSKSSVKSLIKEIRQSADDVRRSLETQVKDLINEKSSLSQECALLREQLIGIEDRYSGKSKELEEKLISYSEKNDELESKLEQITNNNNMLSEELARNQEEQKELQKIYGELSRVKEEHRLVEENLRSVKSQLEMKDNELDSLSGTIESKNQKIKELESEIISLENQNKEYDAKEEEKINSEMQESDNKKLRDDIEHLKSIEDKFKTLKSNLEMEESDNEELKIEIDQLKKIEKKFEILKSQELAKADRIDELKKVNNESEYKYEELEKKYNNLYTTHDSLILRYDELFSEKEGIAHLVGIYQKREKEYAFTHRENEEYFDVIKSLEKSLEIVLDEMESQKGIFNDMSSQYNNGKSQTYNLIEEKTKLQIKNVELLDKIGELTSELTKLEEENLRVSRRIDSSDKNSEEGLGTQKQSSENSYSKSKTSGSYRDGNKIAFEAIQKAKKITGNYDLENQDDQGTIVK